MNSPENNVEQEPQSNKEFDLNYIYYMQELGLPITRKDVLGCNIVIRPEEFEAVGYFEIINAEGELIRIDLENNQSTEPLIIRPEELGQ